MVGFRILLIFLLGIFLFNCVMALKCRTEYRQHDPQFERALRICEKRYLNSDDDGDTSYSESDDSDDSFDSNEDMFSEKHYSSGNKYNNNHYRHYDRNRSNSDQKNSQSSIRGRNQSNSYSYSNNRSTGMQNRNENQNRKSLGLMTGYDNNKEGNYQMCLLQCFFDELNLVDSRGFPEKRAVTKSLTQNIHDPELKDFVEESIVECFHFVNSGARNDKCAFSQNLLSCLSDKGRERCEDWNS